MATWEQRRRGILRTALELERDLFAAENTYIADLRNSMSEVHGELTARLARMNVQPRDDGHFDWERWQTESILADLDRSMSFWTQRATGIVQAGTTAADEMGGKYPVDILSAGGSDMRVRPRLGNPALAAFHAYDAGLVKGVSDKARADVTGIIRRAALGGESVFAALNKIGTVTGKGAFATAFHRGEAIIRTEMGRAYSSADMWSMRSSAADHPGLKKKWLSIIDGRSRPEHAAAHDQVRELDEPFTVAGEKLQHPHDTNGSAWNTINCRCKAVPWDPAWEKLPTPGVAAELGPLAMTDTAAFGSHVRKLEGVWSPLGDRLPNIASSKTRSRTTPARDYQEQHTWPRPMNPSYWRTKPSFTLDELTTLAASQRTFAAFLRERYGIRYGMEWQGDRNPLDIPVLDAAGRLAVERALEMYRALDPALVVENINLREITNAWLGLDVLGEMSFGGTLALNPTKIGDYTGRKRDPDGSTIPRLSDDTGLEVAVHEVAHAIAAAYGAEYQEFLWPSSSNWVTAFKPLGTDAWSKWFDIHHNSLGVGSSYRELEARRIAEIEALRKEIEAKRQLGYTDGDLEARLQMLNYLENPINPDQSEAFPSEYAKGNMAEDFAESVALALLQPAEFRSTHPLRYAWLQQYIPSLVK